MMSLPSNRHTVLRFPSRAEHSLPRNVFELHQPVRFARAGMLNLSSGGPVAELARSRREAAAGGAQVRHKTLPLLAFCLASPCSKYGLHSNRMALITPHCGQIRPLGRAELSKLRAHEEWRWTDEVTKRPATRHESRPILSCVRRSLPTHSTTAGSRNKEHFAAFYLVFPLRP